MPFKKVGNNDYVGPSGRHFNKKQVALYYATDGFQNMGVKHKGKRKSKRKAKGK